MSDTQAASMRLMANAIVESIANAGDHDTDVIMASLGSVAGYMAQACHEPDKALDLMMAVARGILNARVRH
jgi:hypothetical protein